MQTLTVKSTFEMFSDIFLKIMNLRIPVMEYTVSLMELMIYLTVIYFVTVLAFGISSGSTGGGNTPSKGKAPKAQKVKGGAKK